MPSKTDQAGGRPVILVSFPYPMCARNIVRSDAWNYLRERARLIIVSHLSEDEEFRSEVGGSGMSFYSYGQFPLVIRAALRALIDAETLKWTREREVVTLRIIEETIRRGLADPILARFNDIFGARSVALARLHTVRRLLLAFVRRAAIRHAQHSQMLQRERPHLALLTHPYTWEERLLTPVLRNHGIPIVATIHSWDNPTTHPIMLERYDRMFVWNAILKAQLMRLYDYRDEEVYCTGMPQLDTYSRGDLNLTRDAFLRPLGIDPQRRLITYACGAPEFVPGQCQIVAHLADLVGGTRLKQPAALVVRLHPGRESEDIAELGCRPHVYIDRPSVAYSANYASNGWRRDRSDERHFLNLLRHSDVFVNAFSTTTIEAAAANVPIVNIAFDGDGPRPYHGSLRKHYDWEHYAHIVETNGVRLARSYEDLTAAVQECLDHPELLGPGRQRIVREQCGDLDGLAGLRLARLVVDSVHGHV